MDKTFNMDFEQRAEHVREAIAEVLQNNTDLFVEVCEELDNWNGFLGDARCHDMSEIDEFFSRPSELLDKMNDFDYTDEYFYFDVYRVTTASDKYDVYSDEVRYGVTTASDKYDVYSDEVSVDDVIEAIEDYYNHIDIENTTLNELCEILFKEDFGIDEDFDEEDIEDYESDEEFTQRIADIM